MKYYDAAVLRGKTLSSIVQVADDDRIEFTTDKGVCYVMHHIQDCCESVGIHDIKGGLQSLVGSPLVVAREESDNVWPDDVADTELHESFTWTRFFFETETAKVCIRWLGESNGYYSEQVEIEGPEETT